MEGRGLGGTRVVWWRIFVSLVDIWADTPARAGCPIAPSLRSGGIMSDESVGAEDEDFGDSGRFDVIFGIFGW